MFNNEEITTTVKGMNARTDGCLGRLQKTVREMVVFDYRPVLFSGSGNQRRLTARVEVMQC